MDRNYDEVISEMLIELDQIQRRRIEENKRFDKRMEFIEKRMELIDKKLERSIKDQAENAKSQQRINEEFLDRLLHQAKLTDRIIKKNKLKV
jgi:hypothetical protein